MYEIAGGSAQSHPGAALRRSTVEGSTAMPGNLVPDLLQARDRSILPASGRHFSRTDPESVSLLYGPFFQEISEMHTVPDIGMREFNAKL
jgi:hypothetical protein